MIEDLEKLKLAIDVEVKHRYIDIRGKTQCFSKFIMSEANKYYKLSKKNPKWQVISETFAHYPFASVPERRRSIEHLVKVIKSETAQNTKAPDKQPASSTPLKNPAETDVTYVKGVGPKVAYTLNTPAEAGSSRENVWFSWSCNGKESAAQTIRATVTPETDYPVSITAPATISGGFPLEYHDADFNFAVTWASGLTYNEDTTATAPTIDYKYAYAYMEDQESVIVSAAGNHTVSITWTCGEAASEEPIIVTISATAPEV